jgi:hypothetical protein
LVTRRVTNRGSRAWAVRGTPWFDLDFARPSLENDQMKIVHGRIQNGVVVLENGQALPEGAAVTVVYDAAADFGKPRTQKKVRFPLVHSRHPGTLHLTNERIAEILYEEDVVARH